MKKLNWGNVEAASEGYAAPPAGGYVLAICSVKTMQTRSTRKSIATSQV